MELWEKNLAHERAVRDALVACGNPAPTKPDSHGAMYEVKVYVFKSKIFWPFMEKAGHDKSEFNYCACRKR